MKELEEILDNFKYIKVIMPNNIPYTIQIGDKIYDEFTPPKIALTDSLLAWKDKAVQEAIERTLVEIKSVEYPPSGKEWHFQDGEWRNMPSMAVEYIESLTNEK